MNKFSGMTLIELMVALAVGVIILAIGVPSFMGMMSSNQAAGYSNDLVGAIRLARSEAVKRGSDVAICASNSDQTGCSGTDWNNGWIVFNDDDSGNDLDAGETIVRVWSIAGDERAGLVFAGGAPSVVRFVASGANSLDAQLQFSFKKSDCHGNQARQITISRMGRASLDHVVCF